MDRDIKGSLENMPVAEKIVGHQWTSMGTEEHKKKMENPAKKVDYNFAPKLDADMRSTKKHLSDTETRLGHKWVIED